MKTTLTTTELIELTNSNQCKTIEASLILNSGFFATHFLEARRKRLYDIGIDSEQVKWKFEEFLNNYNSGRWLVVQVVV
jgi:hypothetical protein